MDRIKFNQLAAAVANAFGTDRQLLFKRSKKPHIVEPRHILWLVANKNDIRICHIENFTEENGLDVCHSTVIRGIAKAEKLAKFDDRVSSLIESLT
jgi:chromosomal replication initiation ATPase DnaA